ncbi:hypothetical protein D3C78_1807430 [compost metagenome]
MPGEVVVQPKGQPIELLAIDGFCFQKSGKLLLQGQGQPAIEPAERFGSRGEVDLFAQRIDGVGE